MQDIEALKKLLEKESAILDERTKGVELREQALKKEAARLDMLFQGNICELKTLVDNWDKTTPSGLRAIAKDIEQSGATTVGDYRKAKEQERQQGRPFFH